MGEVSLKKLRIEDERVRAEVLEDLPVLASSFSVLDFNSLIESLASYPDSKRYLDETYPTITEKQAVSYQQILEILGKSSVYKQKAKAEFDTIRRNLTGRLGNMNAVDDFFCFVDTLRSEEDFRSVIEEFDVWKKLYDKVPTTYVKKDSDEELTMDEIMRLAFSEVEEDVKKFNSLIKTSGKVSVFASILVGEDNTRKEKLAILESLTSGNIDDVEFVGSGVSGIVFRVGKKVIKFSNNVGKQEIPYHPRLLMPFFRKRYDDFSCLEVYNFGKVKSAQITDEKLLEIYKELEKDGIVWTDAKKENLVELLEDNDLPDYNIGPNFNLYGFLEDDRFPTTEHKVLKKGDIVICDLNNLYAIDDPIAEFRIGMPDKVIRDYLIEKENEVEAKVKRKERDERDGR